MCMCMLTHVYDFLCIDVRLRAHAGTRVADDDFQRHAAFRERCTGRYDESFSSDKVSKLVEASYA